ncbi:MAG: ABC transporter, partial [Betaproteobacteria bacterium]|nr:ABC transporter [Betaproteobacteria bacterium]
MWSELFLVPFLTGLALAVALPLLGCYLRLRDEWLAALAYAHVAAGGALAALVAGLPPALGGLLAAALAGTGRHFAGHRLAGGASQVLLLLGGWSVAVLLAANQPLAERLAQALFDGQLYFADSGRLAWVATGAA